MRGRSEYLSQRRYEGHRSGSGASGLISLLGGIAFGALMMYILDPQQGNRRRAMARQKVYGWLNDLRDQGVRQARNASNHLYGTVAENVSRVRDRVRHIPDDILEERVRAQIGHVVSHPGSLEVVAADGHVIIRGPVLRGELEKIRERLQVTRGVHGFDLEIEEHEDAGSIPGLQGESRQQREGIA